MTEPTDEAVEAIIDAYPGGCNLDVIAAVLGVTRARAGQIVDTSFAKLLRALRVRGIRSVSDLIEPRQYGHNSRDSLFS